MTKLTEQKKITDKLNVTIENQFHLYTKNNQLSFAVTNTGHLLTTYFGKKIGEADLSYVLTDVVRASYLADTDGIKNYKMEQLPMTFPGFGNSDLNLPAIHVEHADGSRLSDLRYLTHTYLSVKPEMNGLPNLREVGEVSTLEISLFDAVKKIKCSLFISALYDYDAFTQHVKLENQGTESLSIERLMSMHMPFLRDDFDLITLTGAWGRESHVNRKAIQQGFQGVSSSRGASGHGQNPFIALIDHETSQDHGPVYAFNLVYSGNFIASCEVDMHQNSRLQVGLNAFDFAWRLDSMETFVTPEVVMVYAENGLNEMSQRFHELYTDCLLPETFAHKERPILINSWEASYFDFNKEMLISLAQKAADVGVELFVLDDGWYGNRQDETTSLGDWTPNEVKLGGTLEGLIEEIHALGLDFGLWFEPEMISEDSELFRAHPDWLIQTPDRVPQRIRSQYVLDLTRTDVQNHLISVITTLLETYDISYVKWDMNRNLTDIYSSLLSAQRQKEVAHRYMLGLYRVLAAITAAHPDVLFEGCAGGGGRFDAGMLAYSSQIWTSDDTDAIARLDIQEGISYVYPSASMSGHVSAVPNHQIGRITSLATRTAVAQQGNFGYELNLMEFADDELEQLKHDIAEYKQNRKTLQFGKHTRLRVNDRTNEKAWQKNDENLLIVTHVQVLAKPNTVPKRLRLSGLQETDTYQDNNGRSYTGLELMEIGLAIGKATHDYFVSVWKLKKEV